MASCSSEPSRKPDESGGGGGEMEEVAARPTLSTDQSLLYRGLKKAKRDRGSTAKERISRMPPCTAGKRSSIYRGVTRHRWTGRYEAHLWDKSTWNQNQNKKGKQVYLGAYDDEEAAARAYDLAALKYWGPGTLINFPVTDYTRDLEEMQNLSREDYLASLRRKSSGFARGLSKYRPLSGSRLDSQFGHAPGGEYLNTVVYGEEASKEGEYVGGFCIDRKIDLSNYIKWWGVNKTRQMDSHSKSLGETKQACSEDIAGELKALERSIQPTEPYEMPCLGVSLGERKHKAASAMSILAESAAYKSLKEKASKKKEKIENDENENKHTIDKIDIGKMVEKSGHDTGSGRIEVALGTVGGLPIQRSSYPLAPLPSATLLGNYSSIDLTDPGIWNPFASVLPSGSSRTNEVMKNESSSDYTFYQQGD